MDASWSFHFPWESTFRTISNNNDNNYADNVLVTKSSFLNIDNGPAVLVNGKTTCTLFDQTFFYACTSIAQTGAIEVTCLNTGSVALTRCAAVMCSTGSGALFAKFQSNCVINCWMTSVSQCCTDEINAQKIISMVYGIQTISNINNSHCKTQFHLGPSFTDTENSRGIFINVVENIAIQAIIICTKGNTVIEKTNVIDNVEQGSHSLYMGAFSTAPTESKLINIGCYIICNNQYLSYITSGSVTFIGCSYDTKNYAGTVYFTDSSPFDEINMILLSTAGIGAKNPYQSSECSPNPKPQMMSILASLSLVNIIQ